MHIQLTFNELARGSSAAVGNENPHVGLECEAISPNFSYIRSFINPTHLAHADTSRNVLPRGGTPQSDEDNT
ncbi:hypothetical protein TNCV_3510411 [Trichonephila clavipes]|nr:hypothetical protein TNCV_3510411 [Trichonephila clavipes]